MLAPAAARWISLTAALAALVACAASKPPLDYPPGPYGVSAGDTIANLRFTTLDGGPFELKTAYRGPARALLIYGTATWCFTCRQEVEWINTKIESGSLMPIAVVIEDNSFARAGVDTAKQWSAAYHPQFRALIDPDGQLDAFRASGVIPVNIVIDTQTMRIVLKEYSYTPADLDAAIASLASKEGGT